MNLGPREPLSSLAEEFRHNASFAEKVRHLQSVGYGGWRRARGDGNCFYRSVGVGLLEQTVLGCGARCSAWSDAFAGRLRAVEFEDAGEHDVHSRLISFLEGLRQDTRPLGELKRRLRMVFNDEGSGLDLAFVRFLRRLTADYLCKNRKNPDLGNGLEPDMLCELLTYGDVDGFNSQVTLRMGREAQDLAVCGLPLALDIGLRLLFLDRNEGTVLVPQTDYGPDLVAGAIDPIRAGERPLVHVQYRPGHYDLIYWRGSGAAK
mmetsp:Transcript_72265/g.223306  ORF Transcript_72265/g.223306 Transcript_72265/m.223306 type:complete len:262 (-) Transcript_72265:287-1072(-)